uniref:Uncharacterized protein n=1 Tax=Reclinomonas americana ATCC 50284 TaxID=1295595 RepID=M4QD26_RECAM|nr:hypothetical protein [Reclinomonas americana ATCC 50284]
MIQYLIQIVYTIQNKLENQYFKKLTINIMKLRNEYHLLSEQEFQKLWIKTKEVVKENGIKKILLNNYLFIIYRSFLGNIGLYYIYIRKDKKQIPFFLYSFMAKYDYIATQNISMIVELYSRILNTTPNNNDIYFFLITINSITQTKNNLYIKNKLNINLMLFLYSQLLDINYHLINENITKEDIFLKEYFSWFFQKQLKYSYDNKNTIYLSTQKEIINHYIQILNKNIKNKTQNNKQPLYINQINIYKTLEIKNQWNKSLSFKYDPYLYSNKTLTEIINKYILDINQTIKKNLKKDYILFENINKQKKNIFYKHPFEINQKPYLKTIQKQDYFLNKKYIWQNYRKKEIINEIYLQNIINMQYLQTLTNSFHNINQNIFSNLSKQQVIPLNNTNRIKNEIIYCSNQFLQIILLTHTLKTTTFSNYVIIIETKEFLDKLTKILTIYQIKWYSFLQNNVVNIFNHLEIETENNKNINIFITNSIVLKENIHLFKKKKNTLTITMELLPKQIEIYIPKHIYILFWNNNIYKYFTNNIKIQTVNHIPKQIIDKNIYLLENIINTKTNKKTLLNKEYLKNTQQLYVIQYLYRLLTDIQKMSEKKIQIYCHSLKTTFIQNIYIPTNHNIENKNNNTINKMIQNIINNNNINKNKKIEFLGIHIQKKKTKISKKEDYKTKIITLQYLKSTYENYSYETQQKNIFLSFIRFIHDLKKETINYNRKITKNDEYLFLLQLIQKYKHFISELLLIKII